MPSSIREKLQQTGALPTLPAAAIHILQLTQDDETELDRIAELIAEDPALSAKILRAVNSSFYGLGQKVSSLTQAVVLLGLHSVKTLVLGFSLVSSLRGQNGNGFNHLAFWRRSMHAAAGARVIAARVLPGHEEDCFIAALLMDIGTLVLDQLLGEQYGEVWERAACHADLPIVETHAFGMTHAEVAGVLSGHWRLPEVLGVPMTCHHGPAEVKDHLLKKITQVIWLAGRCADIFDSEKKAADSISAVRKSCRELYEIGDLDCDGMLCQIGRKTAELAHLFDVRLNDGGQYEQILGKASQRLLELSIAEQEQTETAEKRRATRVRRDGRITIIPCARGTLGLPVQVRLKDISASGIGIVHTEALEKGSQFVIQLEEKGGAKTLLYTVARCETSGGVSSIGGELSAVLRPELTAQAEEAAGLPTTA